MWNKLPNELVWNILKYMENLPTMDDLDSSLTIKEISKAITKKWFD